MSGMTDKYDIPVGDPCFGSQQTSNSNTKVTCPKTHALCYNFYLLSDLSMPMTGSIEADRHMGVTHSGGVRNSTWHTHQETKEEALC